MSSPAVPPIVSEPFGQAGVRRFLFPALTSCSLALMVLSLGMWLRSHQVRDYIETTRDGRHWFISSVYGRLLITWDNTARGTEEWTYGQAPMPRTIQDGWRESAWKRVGIEWGSGAVMSPGAEGGWIRIRWPFVAGLATILPIVRVIHDRRRRTAIEALKQGRCPQCGYDIRATPLRCPECGADLVELVR